MKKAGLYRCWRYIVTLNHEWGKHMNKTKLWLGIGSFVLAGSAMLPNNIDSAFAEDKPASVSESDGGEAGAAAPAAEAGEGGEQGGESGGAGLASYALASTDPNAFQYDAAPQIGAYADLVGASYRDAVSAAQSLDQAIDELLAKPDDATLAAARGAWVKARQPYLQTEVFRFYDGPIENVEGQINAWPMNEAAIDYVKDDPKAGLINSDKDLTIEAIKAANQADDEANVTTGWHAIEFLLWGQDFSSEGPGARPASDFTAGTPANDRRRQYLRLVTEQLIGDLSGLATAWSPDRADGYTAKFKALPPREAVGRMLNGMAILAGFEFMSQRLAVALDSGDQEDEHSCFSDTTHQDFVHDLKGIKNVWTGDGAGKERPGLDELVKGIDPASAENVGKLLADAETKVAALGNPWDKVLASPEGSPERKTAEEVVTALQELGKGLTEAGSKLGVLVLIPAG
jgi:putative iron-regulated protein